MLRALYVTQILSMKFVLTLKSNHIITKDILNLFVSNLEMPQTCELNTAEISHTNLKLYTHFQATSDIIIWAVKILLKHKNSLDHTK